MKAPSDHHQSIHYKEKYVTHKSVQPIDKENQNITRGCRPSPIKGWYTGCFGQVQSFTFKNLNRKIYNTFKFRIKVSFVHQTVVASQTFSVMNYAHFIFDDNHYIILKIIFDSTILVMYVRLLPPKKN